LASIGVIDSRVQAVAINFLVQLRTHMAIVSLT
jgi:hypothetical protein